MTEQPTFDELFGQCTRSAVHLEIRDMYTPEDPTYLDWKAGVSYDPVDRFRDWYDLVVNAAACGVRVRRARIVSEPITDFIRHEFETTPALNLPAGEEVRWLSRSQASDLALPGNDFWVFDDNLVRFGLFAGDGAYLAQQLSQDPAVVQAPPPSKRCGTERWTTRTMSLPEVDQAASAARMDSRSSRAAPSCCGGGSGRGRSFARMPRRDRIVGRPAMGPDPIALLRRPRSARWPSSSLCREASAGVDRQCVQQAVRRQGIEGVVVPYDSRPVKRCVRWRAVAMRLMDVQPGPVGAVEGGHFAVVGHDEELPVGVHRVSHRDALYYSTDQPSQDLLL